MRHILNNLLPPCLLRRHLPRGLPFFYFLHPFPGIGTLGLADLPDCRRYRFSLVDVLGMTWVALFSCSRHGSMVLNACKILVWICLFHCLVCIALWFSTVFRQSWTYLHGPISGFSYWLPVRTHIFYIIAEPSRECFGASDSVRSSLFQYFLLNNQYSYQLALNHYYFWVRLSVDIDPKLPKPIYVTVINILLYTRIQLILIDNIPCKHVDWLVFLSFEVQAQQFVMTHTFGPTWTN